MIWFLYRNVIGYDRIWFLFALEYRNVIKEKGNLIGIEKGTVNRNRKTNKKMRNIKEHLTHTL